MAVRQPKGQKKVAEQAEVRKAFTAVLVDEAEVEPSKRGREAKPQLADDFHNLIFGTPVVRSVDGKEMKFETIKAAIQAGHKSDWFQQGEVSEVKIRSAAKYFGLSVNFAKTKKGVNVFRFAGVFTPRPCKETTAA